MLDGFATGIGPVASVTSGALPMKSTFALRGTSLAIGLALATPSPAGPDASPDPPDLAPPPRPSPWCCL